MTTTLLRRDEAYEIICDLNEEAHSATYEEWEEADLMEEDDPEQAEEMREEASYNQACEFREAFQTLTSEQQEGVLYWAKNDKDFAEEFNAWWGDND